MRRRAPALGLLLVLLAWACLASAETIRIDTGGDPGSRFEIRTVTLPGGEERELYVVSADTVTVRTDDETLVAETIEFDPAAGVIRIVGPGRVETATETLLGEDLVVETDGGRMEGDDVLVITDRVDVRGETAARVEGRVRLTDGVFGPCARCGQRVEDFDFTAERIELLPGDRLVAYDVTLRIREAPVLNLPLLVVPLADPTRTPRLEIASGTASERAEVRIDWPYVAGPNAFGTASLRLLMNVDPDAGGFLDGSLLGGAVERAWLAGAIDHRFYTDRGAGRLEAAWRPTTVDPDDGEEDPSRVRFVAAYDTDEHVDGPWISAIVRRDDDVRDRLVEAEAVVEEEAGPFLVEVSSRVAVPLDEDADVRPSWDGANAPRTVPLRLRAEPLSVEDFRAGPFRLEALGIDIGVFEDSPDPTNRSAAGARFVSHGRVLERHVLVMEPSEILGLVEVRGRMDFVGRYYDTGERLVDWDSWIEARRRLGDLGELTVRLRRDTAEGETPFAFDRIPLRTRSDLTARLDLSPFEGLDLAVSAGYVFEDDRRPDEVGFGPIETEVEILRRSRVLDLVVAHRADPRREDVGTIEADVALRAPGRDLIAEAEVEALLDLDPERPDEEPTDESRVDLAAELGARDLIVARAETGRVAEPEEDEGPWEPLDATLTAGTLRSGDARPGLELLWRVDPNDGTTLAAGYEAAAEVGPLRAELSQEFGEAGGRPGDHEYRLEWTDVVALEVEGPELIPGDLIGLAADPDASRRVRVRIEEDRRSGTSRFRAEYRATHVPLDDGGTETRASVLTASALVAERRLPGGWGRLAIDAYVDVPLRDDALERTYLRRANLELGLDVAGRVGLQGTVGYRGRYDSGDEAVVSGRLALEEVSLVVHPTQELYLGATIDDVWEIVADDPGDAAFDPRPTLFATWDRCCWALYGSWDTRTGEIAITLGAPGTGEGLQLPLPEGPTVPWRDETAASTAGTS